MGVARGSARIIILLLATTLLVVMLALWMKDGDWHAVLIIAPGPLIGVWAGSLFRSWRKARKPGRRSFRCNLRFVSGSLPPLTPKWTHGVATPRIGSLAFQPKAARFGRDVGDVVHIRIYEVGRGREPTWVELVFRFPLFWRILCFDTDAGRIELAAGRNDICSASEAIHGQASRNEPLD